MAPAAEVPVDQENFSRRHRAVPPTPQLLSNGTNDLQSLHASAFFGRVP